MFVNFFLELDNLHDRGILFAHWEPTDVLNLTTIVIHWPYLLQIKHPFASDILPSEVTTSRSQNEGLQNPWIIPRGTPQKIP